MRRVGAIVVGALAIGAAGCGGQVDAGTALQAAGILAAVERTEGIHASSFVDRTGTALEDAVLCVTVAGNEAGGSADDTDPPTSLLDALAAAGREAVAGSACDGTPGWTPDSDEPMTVTGDGDPGHRVRVTTPDVEGGRVTARTLHWYMSPHTWSCTARQVDGAWVIQECEEQFGG